MKKSIQLFHFTGKKLIHFLTFVVLFVCTSFLALLLRVNFLTFNIIVLLPSVAYLFYLNKQSGKSIFLDGLITGFFADLLFDTFAHKSRSWFSPSVFSFRPLGIPIENLIWGMLYVLLIFAFYEYFFDSSKSKKLPSTHRYWLIAVTLISLAIPMVYAAFPQLFFVPYFYFFAVIIMIIVDYLVLKEHPKFATKAVLASFALLPLAFVHEFVSLELHYWIFEIGYHVGYINLLGYVLPIEELFFFISAPIAAICIYEIFIDNRKA